ncbi:hypothetical protein [Elizabethkingia miricola]|uniref:hypothetical protein n=1 Tax=Elizabethkingia miricola TaxID=172045 RepID=UPI0038921EAC
MKRKEYKNWCLLEDGYVHTSDLTFSEAEELCARHERFFPDICWSIMFMPN